MKRTKPLYWRSQADLDRSPDYVDRHQDEFPEGALEAPQGDGVTRRSFMGLMGASMALAGATMSGCIRKEQQFIVPYSERPPQMIPGEFVYFRTAACFGGRVQGLHVTTQDFRPIKVEGNPLHPMNGPLSATFWKDAQTGRPDPHRLGGTTSWSQASVLDLYDQGRSKEPVFGARYAETSGGILSDEPATVEALDEASAALRLQARVLDASINVNEPLHARRPPSRWALAAAMLQKHLDAAAQGAGLGVVVPALPSPTIERLLGQLKQRFPQARLYRHDLVYDDTGSRALDVAVGAPEGKTIEPVYRLDRARVILSIDNDFLGLEGNVARNMRLFADGRRAPGALPMNRLYTVSPAMNPTTMMADEQLRLPASQCGYMLAMIARALFEGEASPVAGLDAIPEPDGLSEGFIATWLKRREADERFGQVRDGSMSLLAFWARETAADLQANRGKAVVLVGQRQPAWVHMLGALINDHLGAVGALRDDAREDGLTGSGPVTSGGAHPMGYFAHPAPVALGSLADLAADLGTLTTLMTLDVNLVLTAPSDLELVSQLLAPERALTLIHFGAYLDETAALADLHLPRSHYLEAWCDWRAAEGTISVQQPIVEPLFQTISDVELLAAIGLADDRQRRAALIALANIERRDHGHQLVRATWQTGVPDPDWKRALYAGVLPARASTTSPMATPSYDWSALTQALRDVVDAPIAPPSSDALEVNFVLDASTLDGRTNRNVWLQELPDPITKLTWDNAALLSPRTAEALGVRSAPYGADYKGDLVTLTLPSGATTILPVMLVPGMADNVVVVGLGFGRTPRQDESDDEAMTRRVAEGGGFDVYPLRTAAAPWFAQGATIKATGDLFPLATTQEHWVLDAGFERPMVQEVAVQALADPTWKAALRDHIHHLSNENDNFQSFLFTQSNFWVERLVYEAKRGNIAPEKVYLPRHNGKPTGRIVQQWGMVIDLNTCTGCSTCLVACQAENNIPVVGKERVLNGREMHWIRIDRYYRGDDYKDPESIVVQPLPCMHCETAPCESVCPVAATVHSPEGTNDMVYNRCIGTRYCSNNCPYKVRRYNFFNYQKENDEANSYARMQKNPNVSIRFRGVMEKCTYCIQRIMEARIAAKRNGQEYVRDGGVNTACAQACPANAIIFGDISDPASKVHRIKYEGETGRRNYAMLAELNTHPRTTYLARVRNFNPALHPVVTGEPHSGH